MRLRHLTPEDVPRLLEMQRRDFPEQLWEEARTYRRIVGSCDLNLGIEHQGVLVAAALAHPGIVPGVIAAGAKQVYFFSLEVVPEYRGRGLGARLIRERLKLARREGLAVELHCMDASYPLYSRQRIAAGGYRIVSDRFIPGFYKQWGLNADAHHLRLEPR